MYGMSRDEDPCRDPGTDTDAFIVNRNASQWLRQLGRFGVLWPSGDRRNCRVNWKVLQPLPH